MPKTSSISLLANAMTVTRDPVADNIAEVYPKSQIVDVQGAFMQKPINAQEGEWHYKYDTMTMLCLRLSNGVEQRIELQEVSNQATWNTGLLTGLQQAVADIQTWL
jgi:hypothetical protein